SAALRRTGFTMEGSRRSVVTSAVQVRMVRTSADRKRFIAFPYEIYRNCRYWVAPLRRDQKDALFARSNPFFIHSTITPLVALDASGRVVGRIAAIVNGAHLKTHNDDTGFFGFFECIDDDDVASALFRAATDHLRAHCLKTVRGPMNPSVNESSGLLINGFDRSPSILLPYNPPYYEQLLTRRGFERAMTMRAYYGAWKHLDVTRLERSADVIKRRVPGVRIRNPNLHRFMDEALTMHRIYNAAFAGSWGHAPITEAEFLHMAKAMRPIVDPNLIFFLEHDDRPVGFSLSLPNVNLVLREIPEGRLAPFGFLKLLGSAWFGKPNEFRTLVLALLPAYQRRGLDSLLIFATIESGRRNGYLASELSWVMDNNTVLKNSLSKLGAVIDKEYGLFEMRL